ncbi:MAG: hypothetical protein KKF67_02285, partial [Nanoarchaeota archaeon]|nr:hypothetical protein [Nanoarchaeota archaeon]
ILLKLNILLNGETVSSIKITNNDESEQNFNLYFDGLEGVAFLNETEFKLGQGQSKELKIYLKDEKGDIEIYLGVLVIETLKSKKKIPIMLTVEDKDKIFAIVHNIVPAYEEIRPGGKLKVDVTIYNLADNKLHNIEARYFIKNFDNELILSEDKSIVIDKGRLGMIESVDIPEDIPYGDYVFITSINYDGVKSIAANLFTISEKKEGIFSGDLKFFVIVLLIFVLGILVAFLYFIKTRDNLLIQLKKQQDRELRENLELIKRSRHEINQLKNVPERKKKIRKLAKTKKNIIKKIKLKQRAQRKEFEKLKKQGKKSEMEKRLIEWKKRGYKIFETKNEIKKVSKQGMKRHMKDIAKKGYKVGFLKNKKVYK